MNSSLLAYSTVSLTAALARICYAYQQLNDIGIFDVTSISGSRKRTRFHRYREEYLPEYHGGENAPGPVLTQAGAKFSKERPATVGVHRGEMPPRIFPTPLTPRACLQLVREILGDLRTFPSVFDSAIGDMTTMSHNIMEYVKYPTCWPDPYSRVLGDHKSRRNPNPVISATIRTACTYITGGLYSRVKSDMFSG